jgi:FAD/FMN-containing dehydrogenase
MSTIDRPPVSFGTLRRHLRGVPVIGPGEEGWDAARQAFNTTVDQRPAMIATPLDADDIAAVVRYAADAGLQVAPQRTGHNAGPLGDLSESILLKTDQLQGVKIDAENRTARVRSGAKWEKVVPRASDLGLAALHGSTPDVSVAGYSLGGGLGWYGRKHGLAANSVTAIELVTADGELRRVDARNEPELFWALRGGGGNFGVVTALEFDLYPVSEVYAGVLFFPYERSSEVLHAWSEWTRSVPDEVTSVGRMLQFPPLPQLPPFLSGKSYVVVEAVFLGSEADGRALTKPLRDLGPAIDTFEMRPPVGLAELHMDPPEPVPYVSNSILAGELSPKALDEFVATTGPGSGSPLVSVELRHLGGALGRTAPHHGAVSTLPGNFAMFAVGMAMTPEMGQLMQGFADRAAGALAPYAAGRYSNFTEEQGEAARFFGGETWERLRAVKGAYDPGNLFRANHQIPPAEAKLRAAA